MERKVLRANLGLTQSEYDNIKAVLGTSTVLNIEKSVVVADYKVCCNINNDVYNGLTIEIFVKSTEDDKVLEAFLINERKISQISTIHSFQLNNIADDLDLIVSLMRKSDDFDIFESNMNILKYNVYRKGRILDFVKIADFSNKAEVALCIYAILMGGKVLVDECRDLCCEKLEIFGVYQETAENIHIYNLLTALYGSVDLYNGEYDYQKMVYEATKEYGKTIYK